MCFSCPYCSNVLTIARSQDKYKLINTGNLWCGANTVIGLPNKLILLLIKVKILLIL